MELQPDYIHEKLQTSEQKAFEYLLKSVPSYSVSRINNIEKVQLLIRSRISPDEIHTVQASIGEIKCTCRAGQCGKQCWHKTIALWVYFYYFRTRLDYNGVILTTTTPQKELLTTMQESTKEDFPDIHTQLYTKD